MNSNNADILILHPSTEVCRHFERAIAKSECPTTVHSHTGLSMQDIAGDKYQLILAWDDFIMADNTTFLDYYGDHPLSAPVIFISNDGSTEHAVAAVRSGAVDFLLNSADEELICQSVRHALTSGQGCQKSGRQKENEKGERRIITQSKAVRQLLKIADRVAQSDATILIHGESGTGKELLARYIHSKSERRNHAMVAMNCAALPEQLAESELFGYEKGAFTGAVGKRRGRFEQAHRGTLLLDEISEMPFLLQAKLLRVLQEKEIDPVGGNGSVPVDVRVIATTNKNLVKMTTGGTFREDLYYRLRVVPLEIPPLRERPEDIPLLTAFFIEKHGSVKGIEQVKFSCRAMDRLCSWQWPGNVRELENTVIRALLISPNAVIEPDCLLLDRELDRLQRAKNLSLVGRTVAQVEKDLISQTLTHVNQNRTHAAKMLGISIRTLRNKLHAYQASQTDPADIAANE